MTTTQTVVTVLVVVLVLALVGGALLALRGRRRREAHREEAEGLRGDAAVGIAGVQAQQRRADELEHEATKARERADLLEERAREQRLSAEQAEAGLEDAVRRADALDPDVDHRAHDYRPDLAASQDATRGAPAATEADVRRPTDPHDPDFDAGPQR